MKINSTSLKTLQSKAKKNKKNSQDKFLRLISANTRLTPNQTQMTIIASTFTRANCYAIINSTAIDVIIFFLQVLQTLINLYLHLKKEKKLNFNETYDLIKSDFILLFFFLKLFN